jgi:hypothetical protein
VDTTVSKLSVAKLEERLAHQLRFDRQITFTSRGRKITFWRNRKANRMMVTIGKRPAYKALPNVEVLARMLQDVKVCRLNGCPVTFTRSGRKAYCTPQHAAQDRKRRWLQKQASS